MSDKKRAKRTNKGPNGRERKAMDRKRKLESADPMVASDVAMDVAIASDQVGEVATVLKMVPKPPRQSRSNAVKDSGLIEAGKMGKLPRMPRAKRIRKPKPLVKCACGCGGDTKSTWVPGHDARHKGWITRIQNGLVEISDERITEGERVAIKKAMKLMGNKEANG